jgi:hypothetical protein
MEIPGRMPAAGKMVALFAALLAGAASAETIEGRVVEDHSGSPLASAGVRVFKVGTHAAVGDLDTDGEGRFNVPGLPAGDYRLEVSKPNYVTTTARIPIAGGAVAPAAVRIRLARCGVIAGQIADAQGQPVSGAYAFALPAPPAASPLQTFNLPFSQGGRYAAVDGQGRFRLYNLLPGHYVVAVAYGASTIAVGSSGSAVVRPGLGSGVLFYPDNAQPQSFTISGGDDYQNIDFTVAPAALYGVSGKVEPAAPGGKFWLALTTPGQPAIATAVTEAQQDGSFRFEGIPPGSYQLLASGPATARGTQGGIPGPEPFFGRTSVEVGARNVEGVSVAVEGGRSVLFLLRVLHAQLADAACPQNAQIRLSPLEDWGAMLAYSGQVSSTREQRIDHLAPGRYLLSVTELGDRCYGVGSQILDLTRAVDVKPVEVLVAPAAQIRGRLTGSAGPGNVAVALWRSEAGGQDDALQIVFADAGSRFGFDGLRPGRYRIAAQWAAEDKARWIPDLGRMVEIEVPGGAPTDVEIPAPKANGRRP